MDFMTIIRILWDRLAAWVTVLAGIIAVLLGIIGVRDNAYVAAQMPYVISGGILGLFLLGLGATLWLSADLRDQWRALLEIRDEMRAQGTAGGGDAASGPGPQVRDREDGRSPASAPALARSRLVDAAAEDPTGPVPVVTRSTSRKRPQPRRSASTAPE